MRESMQPMTKTKRCRPVQKEPDVNRNIQLPRHPPSEGCHVAKRQVNTTEARIHLKAQHQRVIPRQQQIGKENKYKKKKQLTKDINNNYLNGLKDFE